MSPAGAMAWFGVAMFLIGFIAGAVVFSSVLIWLKDRTG